MQDNRPRLSLINGGLEGREEAVRDELAETEDVCLECSQLSGTEQECDGLCGTACAGCSALHGTAVECLGLCHAEEGDV